MARAYFSLLSRDVPGARWCIEFGDYDRETVADEAADYREQGHKARNLKIIRTAASQAAIVAAVEALNSKGV